MLQQVLPWGLADRPAASLVRLAQTPAGGMGLPLISGTADRFPPQQSLPCLKMLDARLTSWLVAEPPLGDMVFSSLQTPVCHRVITIRMWDFLVAKIISDLYKYIFNNH